MDGTVVQADASELVQGLLSPAPSEAFSISRVQADGTRKDIPIRVRLLRETQTGEVLREAQAYAKKMGEDPSQYRELYESAQMASVVARAMCHPDEKQLPDGTRFYRPMFVDADQVRDNFGEPEIAAVINCLEVVKAKYWCLRSFEPEDIDMWAARLSDSLHGEFFLGQLDSAHWPELIFLLAHRVRGLSEKTGHPLSSLLDTSGSDPKTSPDGTSGSTSSPIARSSEGDPVTSADKLITKDEARAQAKKLRKRKK